MQSQTSELVIVRAGAGAGKTTDLTQNVVNKALSYIDLGVMPKFVVCTFTRKATQELRERIMLAALRQSNPELVRFVASTAHLKISTIHGVLSQFLTSYGHLIGLPPEIRYIDSSQEFQIARKAFTSLPAHLVELEVVSLLGPARIIQALINAAKKYMSDGFLKTYDQEILESEWTRLLVGLLAKLNELLSEIETQTDNSKWLDYVRAAKANLAELFESPLTYDLSNRDSFAHAVDGILAKPQFRSQPFSEDLKETLFELLDQLKGLQDLSWSKAEIETTSRYHMEFSNVLESFVSDFYVSKISQGLITTDDIEVLSQYLLRQNPEAGVAFSEEWQSWYVDEFQDTSPTQVQLLDQLMHGRDAYFVGDPQQSIYLFRGARVEVFEQMETRMLANPIGQHRTKMKNYRSEPRLMEFINLLVTQASAQFRAMETRSNIDPTDTNPVCWVYRSGDDLYEQKSLVQEIHRCLQAGSPLREIAVLCRKNSDVKDLAAYLQECGVPCQTVLAEGFSERREILDALQILKFLCHTHDNENLIGLLRGPWFHIADEILVDKLFSADRPLDQVSHWTKLINGLKDHPTIQRLESLRMRSKTVGIALAWKQALIESDFMKSHSAIDPTGRREANVWKLISQFQAEERTPGFQPLKFLDSALKALTDEGVSGDSDALPVSEPNRVYVMTVHKSKGLEFDHIIIPHMQRGIVLRTSSGSEADYDESLQRFTIPVPSDAKLKIHPAIEGWQREKKLRMEGEDERLFYVALTRAKKSVAFTINSSERNASRRWSKYLEPFLNGQNNLIVECLVDDQTPDFAALLSHQTIDRVRPQLNLKHQVKMSQALVEKPSLKQDALVTAEAIWTGIEVHAELQRASYGAMSRHNLTWIFDMHPELPADLFSEGGLSEWGFSLKSKERIIEGRIDLWGQDQETVYVVDYKTGSSRYAEIALQQLKIYAWALSKWLPHQKNFAIYAVYLAQQQVRHNLYTRQQIEAWASENQLE